MNYVLKQIQCVYLHYLSLFCFPSSVYSLSITKNGMCGSPKFLVLGTLSLFFHPCPADHLPKATWGVQTLCSYHLWTPGVLRNADFTSRFPSYFPMVSHIYVYQLPPPLPQQVIVRGEEKKVSERTRRRLPENPTPCWGGGRAGGSRAWRPACPASLNEGAWEAQGHFSGCPVIPAREPDTRARFLARVVF